MVPYPTELPLAEISDLVQTLMGLKPADMPTLIHEGWHIVGFLLGKTAGSAAFASAGPDTELTEVEVLEALINCNHEGRATVQVSRTCSDKEKVGFVPTGLLIKLALPFLMKWLQKWIADGGSQDLIDKLKTQDTGSLVQALNAIQPSEDGHFVITG